ncbi:MAG: PASTA domain-containing protein [Paludibacteraceae bacterium]|nr:PASTA domain-containing protein [Paludibacteraceae bacterium]
MDKKKFWDKQDTYFVIANIAAAVIVAGIVLTCLIIWLRGYTQHGVEVTVADVKGLTREQAELILHDQGLNTQIVDSTYSSKVPFGTIVDQDPQGNSHAKAGRVVYLTINASGRPKVAMPNLQDMSYRQAETTLRGMGLRVDSVYEYEPSAYRDLVLDVKANGQSVQPGEMVELGTKVRLVIGFGKGTNKVIVPNVVGLTLQDARSLLLSRRLTVGATHYDEPRQDSIPAYVYNQVPETGEQLTEGETVTLYLSTDIEKTATSGSSNEDDSWF